MKINRNMSAVLTNKQMHRTENKLAASMERLSSGVKITKPGDNPSGMAISNKMRAQIKALDQAGDNSADAVSVMQIADSALNETTSVLQRIRELSVQAANDTNTYEDRQSIQAEIDELMKEVDRISSDTEYNTKTLLDGSSDTRVYTDPKCATRINISDQVNVGDYKFTVDANAAKATCSLPSEGDITTDGSISINGISVDVTSGMSHDEYLDKMREAATKAGCELAYDGANYSLTSTLYGSEAQIDVSISKDLAEQTGYSGKPGYSLDAATNQYKSSFKGEDAQVTLGNGFSNSGSVYADGNRVYITDKNGYSVDFLLNSDAPLGQEVNMEVTDIGKMVIQTGGNEFQTIDVRIPEISAETLYLDSIDVTVVNGASRAITIADEALAKVNEARSRIGAYQNRLEYTENSLSEASENMTSAYSTLMDTDMAEEMTEYTQQNILEQAAISVLSQANELPQQVLSLLQ